jgi:hypothetical protein
MRIIDSRWTDLAGGFEAVGALQGRLEKEFGRAVRIGHARKFRQALTEWQKKRRVFFALAAFAPFSLVGLCVSAYYFREVACVIVYWAVVVLTILVTLAVAGRNYIREAVNRPEPKRDAALAVDLEQRWWDSLTPKETLAAKQAAFTAELESSLDDDYLYVPDLPGQADQETLLVGPTGIWVFVVRDWEGTIDRQGGSWRRVRSFRDKWGRQRRDEEVFDTRPDDEWLRRKGRILKAVRGHLPEQVAPRDLVQGGVAFSHPRAVLDKARIQGNTAAYGPARAWVERVRRSQPAAEFTTAVQLRVLDLLQAGREQERVTSSAGHAAVRLYQQAVQELRSFVSRLVKE